MKLFEYGPKLLPKTYLLDDNGVGTLIGRPTRVLELEATKWNHSVSKSKALNAMSTDLSLNLQSTQGVSHNFIHRFLGGSGVVWFCVAVTGQLVFTFYVFSFYGGSAISGNLAKWAEVLPSGIISGDTMGNFALAGHLALAVVIFISGPIQFVDKIRMSFPKFHHWNGRIYMTSVVLTSLFGAYMIWTRGTAGDISMDLGVTFNAVLIISFVYIALKRVLAKRYSEHKRWALRLWIVVCGVWFFRIGLMFWLAANQGPVGIDFDTFTGPFLTFWAFGQYLLPLAILELYFVAKDSKKLIPKYLVSVLILASIIVTGMGTFVATMGMWLPRL